MVGLYTPRHQRLCLWYTTLYIDTLVYPIWDMLLRSMVTVSETFVGFVSPQYIIDCTSRGLRLLPKTFLQQILRYDHRITGLHSTHLVTLAMMEGYVTNFSNWWGIRSCLRFFHPRFVMQQSLSKQLRSKSMLKNSAHTILAVLCCTEAFSLMSVCWLFFYCQMFLEKQTS